MTKNKKKFSEHFKEKNFEYFQYIINNKFEDAKKVCDELIRLEPFYSYSYTKRSRALIGLKNYEEALQDINKAIELSPESEAYYIDRANLYKDHLNNPEEALIDFNKAIEIKPEESNSYIARSKFFLKHLNDYEKALTDINKAIELSPESEQYYIDRANLYKDHLNKSEEALEDFKKAITIEPEDIEYQFKIAELYENLKEYDLAIKTLQKAIKTGSKYYDLDFQKAEIKTMIIIDKAKIYLPKCYFKLAEIFIEQKKDAKSAMKEIDKAIKLEPTKSSFYSFRSEIFSNIIKDYSAALKDINKAIELSPESAGYYIERAILYSMKLGKIEDYYVNISQGKQIVSRRKRLKYFKLSLEDTNKAIELDPNNPLIYYTRITINDWVFHNYQQLKDDCDKFIKLTKNNNEYNQAISQIYSIRYKVMKDHFKDYKSSLHDINKAIELVPDNPSLIHNYLYRSELYKFHFFDHDMALTDINKAIELSKDEYKANFYLVRSQINSDIKKNYESSLSDLHKVENNSLCKDEMTKNLFYFLLTKTYYLMKDYSKSLYYIKKFMKISSPYNTFKCMALEYKAASYLKLGDSKKSLSALRKRSKLKILPEEIKLFQKVELENKIFLPIVFTEPEGDLIFMQEALICLFRISKRRKMVKDFIKKASVWQHIYNESPLNPKDFGKNEEDVIFDTFLQYRQWYDDKDKMNKDILLISIKLNLLNEFLKVFVKLTQINPENYTPRDIEELITLESKIRENLSIEYEKKLEEKEKAIAQARIEERNRIMANLSHTVKNMIGTIIDPLENMKSRNELQPAAIDNAIRGANLVRGLMNAMNLSFKGSIEDFQYDIKNADYNNSTSIKHMFIDSLKYSISSMFDGKYFEKFMRNYFPTKPKFLEAKNKWNEISQSSDIQLIIDFMKQFMLKAEIDLDSAQNFVVGNDKGSSLKFLILIQEMVFNAVKYSSFVPRDERLLKVIFSLDKQNVSFLVENKFQPKTKVKSSGLGQEIINNFSKLLQTKPETNIENEIYSVEVKFENLWEV